MSTKGKLVLFLLLIYSNILQVFLNNNLKYKKI
jgi:hypothetical protein